MCVGALKGDANGSAFQFERFVLFFVRLDRVGDINAKAIIGVASLLFVKAQVSVVGDDLTEGVAFAVAFEQTGIAEDIEVVNSTGCQSEGGLFGEGMGLWGKTERA